MILKRILLLNRAPFNRLSLTLDNDNIAVLSGINGAGKTTILSYIVDSFFELARKAYNNEFEGRSNKFYRVSSDIYSMDNMLPSIVYMRFEKSDTTIVDYIDFRGKCSESDYNELINLPDKIPFSTIDNMAKKEDVVKHWSISNKSEIIDIFSNNLLTYFPAYRYEKPSYLNDPYSFEINFNKDSPFAGYLPNPIEVTSDLPQMANWIMDIVLDRQLYQGTASFLFEQLNDVINNILFSKTGVQARLGIGPRNSGASRIAVMSRNNNHPIYPSIFNMSSGELALLCLFGELVKQADEIGKMPTDIKGIVLIDEIDKHLHITLQKETLPKLFAMFPGIQFVISSHSPFLGVGLQEEPSINYKLYDLDNDGIPCRQQDVGLFRDVYNITVTENQRYLQKYNDLQEKIQSDTKPLIITEGKTDWKHIVSAMRRLDVEDLNIDIYKYEDTLGDSSLLQLLKAYARFKQPRKIIGIFDRDNFPQLNCPELETQEFVSFQNNVYGFAIPLVNTDDYGSEISIEHYYKKCDLTKSDENGRRLFLGSEFFPSGVSKDKTLHTRAKGREKKITKNGIIDEKVFVIETDPEGKTSIALSKNEYASKILNDDTFANGINFMEFQRIFDVIRKIVFEKAE